MREQTKFGLLLFLISYFGKISGRTRIQKMLYLTDRIGWDVFKDYYFYQYGPYSQQLKRTLDLLVERGLIEEKEEKTDGDRIIYQYEITEDGSQYLEKVNLQPRELVEKTRTLFETLKEYHTDDLEIMTSLYHIRKLDPGAGTDDRIVEFVKLYKPKFDEREIERGLKIFPMMESFVRD